MNKIKPIKKELMIRTTPIPMSTRPMESYESLLTNNTIPVMPINMPDR